MPEIVQGYVKFEVSVSGVLSKMVNIHPTNEPQDVFIPAAFPSGECIRAIGAPFSYGPFSTIAIDDSISDIREFAFYGSHVKKVIWPASCTTIPWKCFEHSKIEEICNIDKVTSIENSAFSRTQITNFVWPSSCDEIPSCCFSFDALHSISNIDKVKVVYNFAFLNCRIDSLSWPSECDAIPIGCFSNAKIGKLDNLQGVTRIETDGFLFFELFERLDFSKILSLIVGDSAFVGVGKDMVFLPCYMSEDDIKTAEFSEDD